MGTVKFARSLVLLRDPIEGEIEPATAALVSDHFERDTSLRERFRKLASLEVPSLYHHRIRYVSAADLASEETMELFRLGRAEKEIGHDAVWKQNMNIVTQRLRCVLFREGHVNTQHYMQWDKPRASSSSLKKEGDGKGEQREELELLIWSCICRLDLMISWLKGGYLCSFNERNGGGEGFPGGALSEEDMNFLREKTRWMSVHFQEEDEVVYTDLNTLWLCVKSVLLHFRRCDRWHPAISRYITRLYLRMCACVHYVESTAAADGDERMFFGKYGLKRILGNPHHGMINHPFFYKTKIYRSGGGRMIKLQMVNRRFLRESEMIFRNLFDEMCPRMGMISVPIPVEVAPYCMDRSLAIRFCQWSLEVADGVLKDFQRTEMRRRIYQVNLAPCERERFVREDRFGDPTAYNVIARYRYETLDILARWVEEQEDPVIALIRHRLETLTKHPQQQPLKITLPHISEALAFEIVLKYAFDTRDSPHCLLPWMVERYRRHQALWRWDWKDELPRMCQLFNTFELILDPTKRTVVDFQMTSEQEETFGYFIPCFLTWLIEMNRHPEIHQLRSVGDLSRELLLPISAEATAAASTTTRKRSRGIAF